MQATVKWKHHDGTVEDLGTFPLLEANALVKDGCEAWGKGTHQLEPVLVDDSAGLLQRARASRAKQVDEIRRLVAASGVTIVINGNHYGPNPEQR